MVQLNFLVLSLTYIAFFFTISTVLLFVPRHEIPSIKPTDFLLQLLVLSVSEDVGLQTKRDGGGGITDKRHQSSNPIKALKWPCVSGHTVHFHSVSKVLPPSGTRPGVISINRRVFYAAENTPS